MTYTLTDGTEIILTPFHSEDGSTIYELTWGTGLFMVNEFTEYYQTQSLALARLATLAYCVEQDRMFKNEPLRFSTNTIEFFKGETN
jgi:hypothetical protein